MTAPYIPQPYTPKPSIVDRVAARLFPTGAYQGLLDPQAQQGLQHQGLLALGTNLMQAGGAAPYQRGTLANIGASLQGVNFPGMAQQALQLQNYRSQQQDQQLIAAAGARHPAQPGENRSQAYDRITAILSDIISIPGGDAIAAKFAPVLAALKPNAVREPMRVEGINTKLGTPFVGREGTLLIDPDSLQQVGFLPKAQAKATPATNQQVQHAEFGAAALAAWRPVEDIRTKNPGVEEEVGRILASPAFAQAVPGFRSSADAVLAIQKAGGSAAAQQYMRAKWSFLDNVLRTRYATGRLGGPMLAQMAQEFMPSLDTQGNSQVRQNEIQAILSAQGEAGFDANPDVWNRAIKRHGVSNVDLQAILQGGGLDARLNQVQSRYPE